MENSSGLGAGFMAVFAVSGSVVLLAMQAHKRLLSDFMKKMDFEFKNSAGGARKLVGKKKVRFAGDMAVMPPEKVHANSKHSLVATAASGRQQDDENLEAMPLNWQVMYRGILKYRNLRGYNLI